MYFHISYLHTSSWLQHPVHKLFHFCLFLLHIPIHHHSCLWTELSLQLIDLLLSLIRAYLFSGFQGLFAPKTKGWDIRARSEHSKYNSICSFDTHPYISQVIPFFSLFSSKRYKYMGISTLRSKTCTYPLASSSMYKASLRFRSLST